MSERRPTVCRDPISRELLIDGKTVSEHRAASPTDNAAVPGERQAEAVGRHADTLHHRYLQRVEKFGAEGALKWLAAEPSFASIAPTDKAAVERLRASGWSVAVHNDYRLNGEPHTFWLFTHPNGRWVKGEGRSDAEALAEAEAALSALPPAPPSREEIARVIAERALGVTWNMLAKDRTDARQRSTRAVDGWVDYGAHQDELLDCAAAVLSLFAGGGEMGSGRSEDAPSRVSEHVREPSSDGYGMTLSDWLRARSCWIWDKRCHAEIVETMEEAADRIEELEAALKDADRRVADAHVRMLEALR